MGQAGDVQRGGSRLDGPVTSRDKVGRRLRPPGSWWHTQFDLIDIKSVLRNFEIGIGMTGAMAARRSGRGVKRICIDIWATVSRFPMKSLGPETHGDQDVDKAGRRRHQRNHLDVDEEEEEQRCMRKMNNTIKKKKKKKKSR
ncbi:hypothetical protein X777_06161 [Ooceraea biroi]|uniref:Uncharacterized protein n=1 Tax=Ooceraea biroi TaxID=2015173 RepID=A0A026WF24_OOCBI|nr:hypothetical protein X777_06161 [Ooceraea biroi]